MAKMSNIMLALGVAMSVVTGGASQELPFRSGEKVVLFGDSITHMGNYGQYLQLWENLRHPGSGVRFMNCGIAGDTARKGLERFDADLMPMKPNRVFVMFGMNDVGRDDYATTSPSDSQRAARAKSLEDYATNTKAVVEKLAASGMETVLMTPTPYDQYTKTKGENLVECNEPGLASCASIVRNIAAKRGLKLVELHRPMTEMFKGNLDFRFCADRVHPGREGHLVMAAHILKALGASPLVARVEIDGLSTSVRAVENAEVADIAKSEKTVSFTYTPRSLPFPALPEYLTVENKGFFPIADALNREVIVVTGLEQGEYELVFDGKAVARFPADELARGVNVATLDTENQRRAQKAARPMGELREKVSLLRDYALMVNMAVKSGILESDYPRMDAYFDRWLKDTASSRYHSTFCTWVKSYHDVRAKKGEIEARIARLRDEMSAERPAAERVEIRRLRTRPSSAVE